MNRTRRPAGGQLRNLAESLADAMRPLSPNPWPVHLSSVARGLGVASIEYGSMTEDGKTYWEDDRVHIRLSPNASKQRQRFTLAHELAHVALSRPQTGPFHRSPYHLTDEERLCDMVAAALLLPRDRVLDMFPPGVVTLRQIRTLSDQSLVSLAACVLRVNEVTRRNLCLFRAVHEGGRWQIESATNVSSGALARIAIPYQDLSGAATCDAEPVPITLEVGGRRRTTSAHLRCRQGRLLLLLAGLPPGFTEPRPRYP
jgi:Zn-dependent peptidase ImmA (M78 family)